MAYNIPTKDTPKPPGQVRPYPSPTSTGKVEFTVPKTGEKTTTIYRIWGNITPESTPLVCFHGGPGLLHGEFVNDVHSLSINKESNSFKKFILTPP